VTDRGSVGFIENLRAVVEAAQLADDSPFWAALESLPHDWDVRLEKIIEAADKVSRWYASKDGPIIRELEKLGMALEDLELRQ
jgi:hypothetical protein